MDTPATKQTQQAGGLESVKNPAPQHTPGPWEVSGGLRPIVRSIPTGKVICHPGLCLVNTPIQYEPSVEIEANARLIASAPATAAQRDKLLDAASGALNHLVGQPTKFSERVLPAVIDKLRDALASAEKGGGE